MLILKPVELAISSSVASSYFNYDRDTFRFSSPPIIAEILKMVQISIIVEMEIVPE